MATQFSRGATPGFGSVGTGGQGTRYAGSSGEGGRLPGMPIPGDESAFPFGWGGGVPGGGVPQPTYYGPQAYPAYAGGYEFPMYAGGGGAGGYYAFPPQGQQGQQGAAPQGYGQGLNVSSLADLVQLVRKAPEYLEKLSNFLSPNAGQGLQLPAMQGTPGVGTGLSMVPSTGLQSALVNAPAAPYGSGSFFGPAPAGAPQGTSMGLDISQGNSLTGATAESMFPGSFGAPPATPPAWSGQGPYTGPPAAGMAAVAIPAAMAAAGMYSMKRGAEKKANVAKRFNALEQSGDARREKLSDNTSLVTGNGRAYYERPNITPNQGLNALGYGAGSPNRALQDALYRPEGGGRARPAGNALGGGRTVMEYANPKDTGSLKAYLQDTVDPMLAWQQSVPRFGQSDAEQERLGKWISQNPAPFGDRAPGMLTAVGRKAGDTITMRQGDRLPSGYDLRKPANGSAMPQAGQQQRVTQMPQNAAQGGVITPTPGQGVGTGEYGKGVSAAQQGSIMSMGEYRSALDTKTKGSWSKNQTPLQQWESYNKYKSNNLR